MQGRNSDKKVAPSLAVNGYSLFVIHYSLFAATRSFVEKEIDAKTLANLDY